MSQCENLTLSEKEMIRFCAQLHINNHEIRVSKTLKKFDIIVLSIMYIIGLSGVFSIFLDSVLLGIMGGFFISIGLLIVGYKIIPRYSKEYRHIFSKWIKLFNHYNITCKRLYEDIKKRNLCKEDEDFLDIYQYIIVEDEPINQGKTLS